MPLPLRGTGGFNSTEDKGTYDRALLRRSQPKLVFNNYGVKARIPARGGTWVEWRRMEKLSTTSTALTEGTISTETIPTITSVVATVAQYGWNLAVRKLAKFTQPPMWQRVSQAA